MSLFDQLNSQNNNSIQQLKSNPVDFIKKAGFNIPEGMNNPQQIINHLLQSGQVPQSRYTQVMQMINKR